MGIPGKKKKQTRKKVCPPDNCVDRFGVDRMRCKHEGGHQPRSVAAESVDHEEDAVENIETTKEHPRSLLKVVAG